MTNVQFYVLIAIPALGILVNALVFQGVFHSQNTLTARMSSIEARIASVETRMLNLENTFTTRFDLLMGRLMEVEKEIHNR